MSTQARLVEIDEPVKGVRRITLNRPEKRNAMNNPLRGDLLAALREADGDASIHVSIVRGAGPCFSSGYDLTSDLGKDQPYFTPQVGMQWARHVSEGWMSIWDLAKPVIAQVHGYAMAGGLELVGACDLAYAAIPSDRSMTRCCVWGIRKSPIRARIPAPPSSEHSRMTASPSERRTVGAPHAEQNR